VRANERRLYSQATYGALTPTVVTCNVNCSVIFNLCTRTALGLFLSSQVYSFRSCQIFVYVRTKTQKTFLPVFLFEEAGEVKIQLNPQVEHRIRSLILTDRGPHCNQEEWLKELEDTSLANEAKG